MKRETANTNMMSERLLRFFSNEQESEAFLGDLDELFAELQEEKNRNYLRFWYRVQVFKSILLNISMTFSRSCIMFKNYIKIAFRNMKQHKGFTFINIFGLSIGMAGFLLIMMYVFCELSYENFHINRNRIYRVAVEWGLGDKVRGYAGAMPAVGPALKENLSEIENSVRFFRTGDAVLSNGQREFAETSFFFVDPAVFDVFSFDLVSGDKNTALTAPYSIVISQKTAVKYFGTEDPFGKSLMFEGNPLNIKGVMKDIPANTHLRCEILGSFSTLEALNRTPDGQWTSWGSYFTYIAVNQGVNIPELKEKMHAVLKDNTKEWFSKKMHFVLQKLNNIYMYSNLRGEIGKSGNITYVYFFVSVALLVLLTACLNFMNLSTARSLKRVKEIGMRKVLGARRNQIKRQFLGESVLITLISVVFGLILFFQFNPALLSYLDVESVINSSYITVFLLAVPSLIIIVGLIAGSYPALVLSRIKPVDSFAGKKTLFSSRSLFRNILVVFQFSILIALLTATSVVMKQLNFVKNTDLGFDKENVLVLRFPYGNQEAKQKYPVLKTALLQNSSILNVSAAYTVPGISYSSNTDTKIKDNPEAGSVGLHSISIDNDYADILNLRFVSGRSFSDKYGETEGRKAILNRAAVEELGLKDPLGKVLTVARFSEKSGLRDVDLEVIGVIQDFHFQSMRQKIKPLILQKDPDFYETVILKIRPESFQETLPYIKKEWNRIFPDITFNYNFLDDQYNSLYLSEDKISRLFSIFTLFAVFIAATGLFGMSSFITEQRTKEIGIRKVLGASVTGMVVLLTKDFTKWVILANLLAWPAAGYFMNKWLENFAYRTEISMEIYIVSGIAAVLTAVITVSYQTIKASVANPVNSLKYE